MNFKYLLPRIIRHFLPDRSVRFLMGRGLIIKPGLETRSPLEAADRYLTALKDEDADIVDKRVLVFGYGGSYALACSLLENGAALVTLVEKEAPPDDRRNQALLPGYSNYLQEINGSVSPDPRFIRLVQGDIREVLADEQFDIILSSSVFEHLDDVEGITRALARRTSPQGVHLHYIDLRDHFFKYPFEMLCYSKETWYGWLNPTSHHNRWRLPQYRALFESLFLTVRIDILGRDEEAFRKVVKRIKPEFLTGSIEADAVTLIKIMAAGPAERFESEPASGRNGAF